jgi:hypothetical protein
MVVKVIEKIYGKQDKIWIISNTFILVPGARFELATRGFSVLCSTD